MSTSQEYIFTFGNDRLHKYVSITAPCFASARHAMCEKYGRDWAFQYDNREDAGVEKYNLECLNSIIVK